MKDNRHKDQIRYDDKKSFLSNYKDTDFLKMYARLYGNKYDRDLNSAEHLMCDILFRQASFNSVIEYNLDEMKSLLNDLIISKPNFKTYLETYLKQIESALQQKRVGRYNP